MPHADPKPKPLVVFIHGIAASRFVFLYLQWFLWEELENDPSVEEFHIVAHSMGGVVARQALLKFRPRKLKRLLMLATPNKGSAAARKLSNGIFRFSKTLGQISDAEGSYVRELELPTGIEIGAIHAKVDRVVTRESSLPVPGTPLLEIYSGHNDLLIRPATARAALQFLSTGRFGEAETFCELPEQA